MEINQIYAKIEKFNKNGDEMCHTFGCRKHKKLKYVFKGMFCHEHSKKLETIRNNIILAKKEYDIVSEDEWRQEELLFRKFQDKGHMIFKNRVEYIVKEIYKT